MKYPLTYSSQTHGLNDANGHLVAQIPNEKLGEQISEQLNQHQKIKEALNRFAFEFKDNYSLRSHIDPEFLEQVEELLNH